jgi:hypothetical protein
MLGENVRRVARTVDLPEIDALAPDSLLDPEEMSVQVSELAKPLAAANANGR